MKTFLALFSFVLLLFSFSVRGNDFDTSLVRSWIKKGEEHYYNNLDSAYYYWDEAVRATDTCSGKNILRLRGTALNNVGVYFLDRGKSFKSLDMLSRALRVRHSVNDSVGLAESYNNIGYVFRSKGDIKEAIKYYSLSLKYKEELNDWQGAATTYNNIATIYDDFGEHEKALQYYKNAAELRIMIEDDRGLAGVYNNIGYTYMGMRKLDTALVMFGKSNRLYEKTGDKQGLSYSYSNMGDLYWKKGYVDSALHYYTQSFQIDSTQGDIAGLAYSYTNLGVVYHHTGKIKKSLNYLEKSLELSRELGFPDNIRKAASILSATYESEGDYEKAFRYLQLQKQMEDSIKSESSRKEVIRNELEYAFEKEKSELKAKQKQKELMMEAKSHRQEIIKNSFMGGFALMLVIAFLFFRSYRQKKISGREIRKQKEKVEGKNILLAEKNREVIDSITYAKRIQQALLKRGTEQKESLPEHFIYFKPKDIVSGDFYWTLEKKDMLYITVADCTGHGVPGAFLTMLGTSYLNEINAVDELLSPAEILNRLREKIMTELGQKEGRSNKDGIDMALVALNKRTGELQYAGANNPLYIISPARKKALDEFDYCFREIKADKQPIGYHINHKPFTNHKIKLKQGDAVYLFSDGYADQFGGPKGKKFKYKTFKQLLLRIQHEPMPVQRLSLSAVFNEWKGYLEQIDDVCIVGVKV